MSALVRLNGISHIVVDKSLVPYNPKLNLIHIFFCQILTIKSLSIAINKYKYYLVIDFKISLVFAKTPLISPSKEEMINYKVVFPLLTFPEFILCLY